MTKLPEGANPENFQHKTAAMHRKLARSKRIAEHSANLQRFFPNHGAIPETPENEAEAKRFLESMAKFSLSADDVPSSQRTVPYDHVWRAMDREKDLEWYGPDKNTGHCGAKLVSQAGGDFTAYCGVGIWHPSGAGSHVSTVDWRTLLGFCDAGSGYFGGSSARAIITLSVDVHDASGEWEFKKKSIGVCSAFAPAGAIWYAYDTYDDAGSLSLSWAGQPNVTYSVWATAVMEVKTWGPAGAQSNLHVIFDDINPG